MSGHRKKESLVRDTHLLERAAVRTNQNIGRK